MRRLLLLLLLSACSSPVAPPEPTGLALCATEWRDGDWELVGVCP